jgi:hypothetical protein
VDSAELLAKSQHNYLVAPAGCGKTHLIAEAVAKHPSRRELILTHTHAGVDALKRKLRLLCARTSSFRVETIAGWALQYATAFPKNSGQQTQYPSTDPEWKETYAACACLLQSRPIREVVRASYSGLYVDEYQDCTLEQHAIICQLSEILPCRVLGDPLQGIFDFGDNKPVDWQTHVESRFEKLPQLSFPWRWSSSSPSLGEWLLQIRANLSEGKPIDLKSAPRPDVTWVQLPKDQKLRYMTQLGALRTTAKKDGNVVALMKWERECNTFVQKLAPIYNNLETVECKELNAAALDIWQSTGIERMEAVVAFASECLTGVNANMKTVVGVLRKGGSRKSKPYTRQLEMDLLERIIATQSLAPVLTALDGLKRIPETKVWRKELFYDMRRALREFSNGQYDDLKSAAWAVRNKTRHSERKLGSRIISRTLLVKGLEFDHCLILDANALSARNLYVAMTRGARTLTILSENHILKPQ